MSLNLSHDQIELFDSMIYEQVQTSISNTKSAKEYEDDINMAQEFFSTLIDQENGSFVQYDAEKYDKFKAIIMKWRDERFYVLYGTCIYGEELFAYDYCLYTTKELRDMFSNIDAELLSLLTRVQLCSSFECINFHIIVGNDKRPRYPVTNPKSLDIFENLNNLLFICWDDVEILCRIQRNGFDIVPKSG